MALNLVNEIWIDKAKGEVNPLAFSEVAQELAKIIDMEGRNLLSRQEKEELRKRFKNKQERELEEEKLQAKKTSEMAKKMRYEDWLLERIKWKEEKNKPTQIRKFYDAIFNLNQRQHKELIYKEDESQEISRNILAQLHRQLALVHYAKGRKLITQSFVSMMDELIKAVNTPRDLQIITDFLEAFMAFYKECRPGN